MAESVLVKQQLLILNRSRHRAPNLCASDRILAGVCALFTRAKDRGRRRDTAAVLFGGTTTCAPRAPAAWCFRHQLLLPRPYLVLTKPLRLDIQCQRGASVKIGWKYLDD